MPKADNTTALLEATAVRHDRALRSSRKAIRELNATGAAITFGAVATRAGVARSFLYRHGELRAEIERLRPISQANGRAGIPANQRASRASADRRLAVALDSNRQLRDQLQQAEDELVNLRAELRRLRRLVTKVVESPAQPAT